MPANSAANDVTDVGGQIKNTTTKVVFDRIADWISDNDVRFAFANGNGLEAPTTVDSRPPGTNRIYAAFVLDGDGTFDPLTQVETVTFALAPGATGATFYDIGGPPVLDFEASSGIAAPISGSEPHRTRFHAGVSLPSAGTAVLSIASYTGGKAGLDTSATLTITVS